MLSLKQHAAIFFGLFALGALIGGSADASHFGRACLDLTRMPHDLGAAACGAAALSVLGGCLTRLLLTVRRIACLTIVLIVGNAVARLTHHPAMVGSAYATIALTMLMASLSWFYLPTMAHQAYCAGCGAIERREYKAAEGYLQHALRLIDLEPRIAWYAENNFWTVRIVCLLVKEVYLQHGDLQMARTTLHMVNASSPSLWRHDEIQNLAVEVYGLKGEAIAELHRRRTAREYLVAQDITDIQRIYRVALSDLIGLAWPQLDNATCGNIASFIEQLQCHDKMFPPYFDCMTVNHLVDASKFIRAHKHPSLHTIIDCATHGPPSDLYWYDLLNYLPCVRSKSAVITTDEQKEWVVRKCRILKTIGDCIAAEQLWLNDVVDVLIPVETGLPYRSCSMAFERLLNKMIQEHESKRKLPLLSARDERFAAEIRKEAGVVIGQGNVEASLMRIWAYMCGQVPEVHAMHDALVEWHILRAKGVL